MNALSLNGEETSPITRIASETLAPNYSDWADAALNTLMDAWYQNGAWSGLGWWKSANALETVIDYSFVRPLSNINTIISEVSANRRYQVSSNFIGYYYDDEAWWALAWLKAYERTRSREYLSTARDIFTDMLTGWDDACGGGVYWNKGKVEKNAIENELFITLATRLYLNTQSDFYLTWAKRAWTWFDKTGMQGSNGLINDGIDPATCGNNGKPTWTYNQGVILGGLTDLYKITGDVAFLDKARQIATSAMTLLVDNQGVLTEPCESFAEGCGTDGPQFKGIFVRYLSYLYQNQLRFSKSTAKDQSFLKLCETFLATQAASIWNNDRNAENKLGLHWGGPYIDASASTQSSALDALVAAVSL
ncbi:MAG: glycoside hydrolase family 76 protein [Nitrososphaerales archaeon]